MNPPSRPSIPIPTPNSSLSSTLQSDLLTKHSLPVSLPWLSSFLSTIKSPPPPLPALTSTAHFRLLNTDFTHSLLSSPATTPPNSTSCTPLLLPAGIGDVNTKTTTLQVNVPMQVLGVEDVGASRYAQIEGIERVERGEEVKGREVVRVLPGGDDEDDDFGGGGGRQGAAGASSVFGSTSTSTSAATGGVGGGGGGSTAAAATLTTTKRSTGPHRLLLQDAAGTKIYGFEVGRIPKLFIAVNAEDGGVSIGCKVLVRKGTVVRRGLVMLTPEGTNVLGGKVDAWDKLWRGGRKERLKREMMQENGIEEG